MEGDISPRKFSYAENSSLEENGSADGQQKEKKSNNLPHLGIVAKLVSATCFTVNPKKYHISVILIVLAYNFSKT